MRHHLGRRGNQAGFTLIELLTVIGIIIVLISILLPVVSHVRTKAQEADTSQELARLAGACQLYFNDFHSYPGPVPESQVYPNTSSLGVVTSSENLALGLEGGLVNRATAGNPPTIAYDATLVTKGPLSLNPANIKQYNAYTDVNGGEFPGKKQSSSDYQAYKDFATVPTGINDSPIPEFYDHFSSSHPILYMRAKTGTTGIITTAALPVAQYDFRQLAPYGFTTVKATDFPIPSSNAAGFVNNNEVYFGNPAMKATPKGQNAFILISAGADGIYGTKDDIIYGQ